MPKPLREGFMTKREKEALMYRWEFLRRNESYKKDYMCIVKILKVKDTMNCPQGGGNYEEASRILDKWDVLTPIDPTMTFEELIQSDELKNTWYVEALAASSQAIGYGEYLESKPDGYIINHAPYVTIPIDMYAPKERIMAEFEAEIDRWKNRIKGALKNEGYKETQHRISFENYRRYLKVYDLRIKKMDWEQLAQKFYSNDVKRGDLNYAKKKAKRDYRRCLKLIEGSYRQIR